MNSRPGGLEPGFWIFTSRPPASCRWFSLRHTAGPSIRPIWLPLRGSNSRALRQSEDCFVDQLFAAAPGLGEPLLSARFPRAYVDVNRVAFELDPAMFSDELPSFVNAGSPRVRIGLGTIARVVASGEEIYIGKLRFAEAMRRIERLYHPYHRVLRRPIEETEGLFGGYLLIDCHSMPSKVDAARGQNGADIVLGDCFGTACTRRILDDDAGFLAERGFAVAINSPYAGGFTTGFYGHPSAHRHALQIEINRALYMDERNYRKKPRFARLVQDLADLVQRLGQVAEDCLPMTAAIPTVIDTPVSRSHLRGMLSPRGRPRHLERSMTEARRNSTSDFAIAQNWREYSAEEHAIWRLLFERQQRLLCGRACDEFLAGLGGLGVAADGIPDFRRLSDVLDAATGWRIVAVSGLVPDDVFFAYLARRQFPSTCFIRRRDQLDYLQEPDVFHDICGHVPLLMDPVFADYMQAYGEGELKALGLGHLPHLARLYWYTVEFGLIATPEGLRIYGSGILSSAGESAYCLDDPRPNRVRFDLRRVMRTRYRIDSFQQTYFVIDDFQQLFDATRPDFAPIYQEIAALPDIEPDTLINSDREFAPASSIAPTPTR